jgi:hypothetical protein
VLRAERRVGDIHLLVHRGQVPEEARDRPGAVAVEDHKPVPLRLERPVDAHQRLGGRALKKRTRLGVDRLAGEVVGPRVVDVQVDGRVEGRQLDQVGRAESTRFDRRRRRGGLLARRAGGRRVGRHRRGRRGREGGRRGERKAKRQ